MKRVLSFLVIASVFALLQGCATTQSAQTGYVQACATYNAAFATALTLRQQGKLTPAQISVVSQIDQQVTPICTGPLPADPTSATAQITAAVTNLGLTIAIQQEKK